MDKTTQDVRQMYEQFPYPSGAPTNRVGSDTELILSYIGGKRNSKKTMQVLDAGCGRGLGIISAATLQPDVHFHGIDLNRVALDDATASAKLRGLKNITFQECDLMTLEGLNVPAGGYDVIHSSGVLHHLANPQEGLIRLRDSLADDGVINIMVYALYGRQPLLDVAAAITLLFDDDTPLDKKIPAARAAAALARDHTLGGTPFENTFEVDDVEFVDRVLNVNETTYDIPMMWDLLESAKLRFIRWIEPGDWAIDRLLPAGELLQRVLAMPPRDQFRFIELLCHRPGFEMIIAKSACEPSKFPLPEDLENCRFRLHPEVVVGTEVRNTPAGLRTETLTFRLRLRDAVPVPNGPFSAALMYLKDKPGPIKGKSLLRQLDKAGLSDSDSKAVVLELCRQEVIFRVG